MLLVPSLICLSLEVPSAWKLKSKKQFNIAQYVKTNVEFKLLKAAMLKIEETLTKIHKYTNWEATIAFSDS
jgi:hypothetical protein